MFVLVAVAPATATAYSTQRLAAKPRTISPDGDGADDIARVRFRLARASYVATTIQRDGAVIARLRTAKVRAGVRTVAWDGRRAGTQVEPGTYTIRVAIRSATRSWRWRYLTADIEVAAKPIPVPPADTYMLAWPIEGAVTSGFGMRGGRMHQGIDIPAAAMTPIGAAAAGTVRFAGMINGYGNAVIVDHENGYSTLYAHQAQVAVTKGTVVAVGQLLGYVGHTGSSTTDHLHLELRDANDVAVDPRSFLPPR